MKKFEFKMQKLLEIRAKKEDLEKIELAKASGAYQLEVNKKEKILNNVKEFSKSMAADKEHLSINQMHAYDAMAKNADLAIHKLDIVIEEKRKVMQEHIDRYSSAKKDKRAVEIIKEKSYERYLDAANKEEQKEMDEMGKNSFLKHKESGINSENNTGEKTL